MINQKRKTPLGNIIPAKCNFMTVIGKLFEWVINNIRFTQSIISLVLTLSLSFIWISASSAQGSPAFIRQVRAMEADKTGLQNPAGLAFS